MHRQQTGNARSCSSCRPNDQQVILATVQPVDLDEQSLSFHRLNALVFVKKRRYVVDYPLSRMSTSTIQRVEGQARKALISHYDSTDKERRRIDRCTTR